MTTTAVAHNLKEKPRTGDVLINENVTFDGLLLSDSILKGLKSAGFERPSPIQLKAIPLGRCGLDLIVQAKSGTGKTCVFSVVALEGLQLDSSALQVLILAPTREIAIQIWDVIKSIGQPLPQLKCYTFIGGMPVQEDRQKLKRCHIAVGTPGRIKQLIEQGIMNIENIRMFILDEADKLLEESFQEQINWIYSTLPDNKQMLALSATYPEYLAEHLTAYMRNPTFLRLNVSDPALLGIKQYYRTVKFHPLPNKLFERKVEEVTEILTSVEFQQCLIFSNLQTMAQNMADALNAKGWPTACIAGCLDQKDRNLAMEKLKAFKCRVLISTDLTSRGIDADKVNLVINLDVPKDHETYLHRTGRAGRFGTFGACLSIVSDGQELTNLHAIEKKCSTTIYLLTDPIPVDLVKSAGTVNLDDMVSTQKIFTDDQHSTKSVVSGLRSPVKAERSQQHMNCDAKDAEISDDATIKISPSEKFASFRKVNFEKDKSVNRTGIKSVQNDVSKMNGAIDETEKTEIDECKAEKILISRDLASENGRCNDQCLDETKNQNDEHKIYDSTINHIDSEKQTKIKSKPKPIGHKSANFWTQLIEERNDDADYVKEFRASQLEDDIFSVSPTEQDDQELTSFKQEVVDLQLALESAKIEEHTGDVIKRKTPKQTNKQEQSSALASEEEKKVEDLLSKDLNEKVFDSVVKDMKKMEIKIPSLKETIGYSPIKAPHSYDSALKSFMKFKEASKDGTENSSVGPTVDKGTECNSKETDSSLNDHMKNFHISDQRLFHVKIGKTIEYDKELLNKVRQFLSLMPVSMSKSTGSSSLKSRGVSRECNVNDKETEQGQHDQRRQIKAVRSRKLQSKSEEKLKQPLSVQKVEEGDYSQLKSNDQKLYTRNVKQMPDLEDSVNSSNTNSSGLPSILRQSNEQKSEIKDVPKGKCQRPKSHRIGLSLGAFLQDLQSSSPNEGMPSSLSTLNNLESQPDFQQNPVEECKIGVSDQTYQSQSKQRSYSKDVINNKGSVFDKRDKSALNHSSESEDLGNDYSYYKESQQKNHRTRNNRKTEDCHSERKPHKGRHSKHHSHNYNWSTSSEEDSYSDVEDNNPWESYMKHYQKIFSSHYHPLSSFMNMHHYPGMNMQQNPFLNMHHFQYMNMYHQNPYMTAYNPYLYYNPWINPFGQAPFQSSPLTYQQMIRNLDNQQKYMRKMLKNYKRMTFAE